jgi:hypothetical protein
MAEPENVRVAHADGTETPASLVHLGVDDEGMDQWEIVSPTFDPFNGDSIKMDVLPPRTAIGISTT